MLILVLLSSKLLFAGFWLCICSLTFPTAGASLGVPVVPGTSSLGLPSEQPLLGLLCSAVWCAPANITFHLLWSCVFPREEGGHCRGRALKVTQCRLRREGLLATKYQPWLPPHSWPGQLSGCPSYMLLQVPFSQVSSSRGAAELPILQHLPLQRSVCLSVQTRGLIFFPSALVLLSLTYFCNTPCSALCSSSSSPARPAAHEYSG